MTPKEKARFLYGIYYMIFPESDLKCIVKAVSICVDEIIKANPMEAEKIAGEWEMVSCADYWQQVKQELIKLYP